LAKVKQKIGLVLERREHVQVVAGKVGWKIKGINSRGERIQGLIWIFLIHADDGIGLVIKLLSEGVKIIVIRETLLPQVHVGEELEILETLPNPRNPEGVDEKNIYVRRK
jgi:hypothetical protein